MAGEEEEDGQAVGYRIRILRKSPHEDGELEISGEDAAVVERLLEKAVAASRKLGQ